MVKATVGVAGSTSSRSAPVDASASAYLPRSRYALEKVVP